MCTSISTAAFFATSERLETTQISIIRGLCSYGTSIWDTGQLTDAYNEVTFYVSIRKDHPTFMTE